MTREGMERILSLYTPQRPMLVSLRVHEWLKNNDMLDDRVRLIERTGPAGGGR